MQEREFPDINLSIRFHWGEGRGEQQSAGFPATLVTRSLDGLNDLLYESELQTLNKLAQCLELSPMMIDALRHRMRIHRGSALVITRVSAGSIIIEGSLIAISVWFLQLTIGETIKEAWKKTSIHEKLKQLLKTDLNQKVKELPGRIQETLGNGLEQYRPQVSTIVEKAEDKVTIVVELIFEPETAMPPPYGSIPLIFHRPGAIFRDTLQNGSKRPEMVIVPAGQFEMGDIWGDGYRNEKPVHTVRIPKPFAIGRYPITFNQYDTFAKATSKQRPEDRSWGRDRRPAINISWNDAVAYAEWLSQQTGKRYRLPSEAEWEYAARSGGKDEKWAGTSDSNQLDAYAWHYENSGKKTHPVGEKKPNGLGLYDMSGNVMEWVQDWWNEGYVGAPETVRPGFRRNPGCVCSAAVAGASHSGTLARPPAPGTPTTTETAESASVSPRTFSHFPFILLPDGQSPLPPEHFFDMSVWKSTYLPSPFT